MAVYRIQMPDGSVARIQADTSDDAMTHATSLIQKPGASQNKGARSASDQTDYLRELQKARAATEANPTQTGGALGKLNSFAAGEMAPVAGEIIGGLRAGGNAAANLYRKAVGKPEVSSRAIYEANRDETDEEAARETAANPVSAGTGSVASLLAAGGELAKGVGLLKGLSPVAKATKAAKGAVAALPGATKTAAAIAGAKALAKANVNPKVLAYGGNVTKGAGTGAALGGALGFAEGDDLESRLGNAEANAGMGAATGGLLEGVVAPVAKPFLGAGADLARGVITKLRPGAAPGALTEGERIAARRAVGKIAQDAGVTSDNLAGRIAPYAGLDQTVAEASGSSGQSALGSTARRSGTTGDNLRTQIRARTIGQPQGIMGDFEEQLGVDPAAAQGDIEAMVKAGQQKAGPAFDAYYEATAGGVQDPEVERLLGTPMGQKLMKGIQTRAANLGRPAEALTYGRVEVPETAVGVDGAAPEVAPPTVRRAPSAPPSQGLSLTQFVAREGGMSNAGAEGAPEEVVNWRKRGFGFASKAKEAGGLTDEELAHRAWERGYFPDHVEAPPTPAEFQKALVGDAVGGRKVFARPMDEAAKLRFEGANADEEAIYRGVKPGGPEEVTEDSYGGSGINAPEFEPALQTSPTGETLDRIRRRANAAVTRDVSGRPVLSGPKGVKNEERSTWAREFSEAVSGAPGAPGDAPGAELLRHALDTSSDYLGIGKAFKDFQGQLTRGSASTFGKAWKALRQGAEQDAARGALAHDVIDLWGRGQLKGGKFATPGIRQKLELAFGKKGATAFVDQMERRAELAASGARMAPFSGSPTMTLQEAAAATNDMAPVAGSLARIGGKLAKGKLVGAVGEGVGALSNYVKTAGSSVGFRNELGRILSLPSDDPEFVALLKEIETMPPEARADLLKVIGGGRLGGSWPGRLGAGGAVMADQTRHD